MSGSTCGHVNVNVSPKGLDSLRILSPSRIAYLDLTGSGDALVRWAEAKGEDVLESYRHEKNRVSIDGMLTPIGERRVEV